MTILWRSRTVFVGRRKYDPSWERRQYFKVISSVDSFVIPCLFAFSRIGLSSLFSLMMNGCKWSLTYRSAELKAGINVTVHIHVRVQSGDIILELIYNSTS